MDLKESLLHTRMSNMYEISTLTDDFGDNSWLPDLGERPMEKTTCYNNNKGLVELVS
jgi:hypothetical protein